tara:strand:+ start:321 stop:512 length:192 start_codon:yes stop_codon:yes gene_type:complete
MKFECNIDIDNDVFVDDLHFELSKIIKKVAKEVDFFACLERSKTIWDRNGNRIGIWKIIRESK